MSLIQNFVGFFYFLFFFVGGCNFKGFLFAHYTKIGGVSKMEIGCVPRK